MLSKRALHLQNFNNFKGQWIGLLRGNKYHQEKNPQGIIDLGTAENKLVEKIISEKLNQPEVNAVESPMHYYFDEFGVHGFRSALSEFLTERLNAVQTITPDNIVVTSGCGAALDLLSHVIADPGDVFLCPSPFFPMIPPDMGVRSLAEVAPVPLTSEDNYHLTAAKLEKAFQGLSAGRGKIIKGLILLNPNNPLGTIYSRKQLEKIMEWAASHKIHVIVDEIYAMSVFDETAEFTSIAALDCLPDPERTHIVWGFSKDFSLSGFRAGLIISWNQVMLNTIKPLLYYGAIPAIVQHKLQQIVSDKEWLDKVYFKQNLEMLRDAYEFCQGLLEEMGVEVLPPKAGVFLWANFSKFIVPRTQEAQKNIFNKFIEAGVYVEPADAFFSEDVGWFRIVFAYPRNHVKEGLRRIGEVLEQQ